MRRKLIRVGKVLAGKLRASIVKRFAQSIVIRPVREFDGGRVTDSYRRAVKALLDRRAGLYRRLAG